MPPRPGNPVDYAFTPLNQNEAAPVAAWTASAVSVGRTTVISFGNSSCPVCNHDALPSSWSPPTIQLGGLGVAAPPINSEQIAIRCACREPHRGRPVAEAFGCGRAWSLKFDWDSTPTVTFQGPGPAPTEADLGFAKRFADLKQSELSLVRSHAEGWAKVMAALTGLVGVGQLFAGLTLANALTGPWRNAIGYALLAAMILAAASSVVAGFAAYGPVGKVTLVGSGAAGGQANLLQDEIDKLLSAIKPLLIAAGALAAATFILIVFVGAAVWWAPRTQSAVCILNANGKLTKLTEMPKVTGGSLVVVACGP